MRRGHYRRKARQRTSVQRSDEFKGIWEINRWPEGQKNRGETEVLLGSGL